MYDTGFSSLERFVLIYLIFKPTRFSKRVVLI